MPPVQLSGEMEYERGPGSKFEMEGRGQTTWRALKAQPTKKA